MPSCSGFLTLRFALIFVFLLRSSFAAPTTTLARQTSISRSLSFSSGAAPTRETSPMSGSPSSITSFQSLNTTATTRSQSPALSINSSSISLQPISDATTVKFSSNPALTSSSSSSSSEVASNIPPTSVQISSTSTRAANVIQGTAPTRPLGSAASCGGSATGCWGNLSIETDFEVTWPTTGKTVEYNFTITNTTCTLAGYTKQCLLINNQYPGPVIEADWGDTVKVNVRNLMQDNGIHWHGIRQKGSNDQDGVPGLVQCPVAPGESQTWTWQATSYGTSWYHSHQAAQYGDGIAGPIVIHGPASADYDLEMPPIGISEAYHGGSTLFDAKITTEGPLVDLPENILFNGLNVDYAGVGKRLVAELQPGKKHLMRFINMGVDNQLKVGIDGHTMQVVALDHQPVKPYLASFVSLGVGQRFDAILTANSTVSNYWLRAIPMQCYQNSYSGFGSQNAIIRYAGAPLVLPYTEAGSVQDECVDEPLSKTIPFVTKSVSQASFNLRHLPISSPFKITSLPEGRVFRWIIGNTTQNVEWENPILQRLVLGNTTVTPEDNIVGVDERDTWAYFLVQNTFGAAHPMHLHGNDLRVLGSGEGEWDQDVSKLQFTNPMRRDTFMMRAGGWTMMAFFTDNPGVWLLHCHIAWHASEGLSTSIYVRKQDINLDTNIAANIQSQCKTWQTYYNGPSRAYAKFGSGI